MLFSKRKSQRRVRSRGVGGVTLRAERLESRALLAIDLTQIAGTAANNGFGVLNSGAQAAGGAGWSVAEVGDVLGNGYDSYLISAPTVAFTGTSFGLGSGAGSRVFLVFGSVTVNSTTINDFLNLTVEQRVSDLANLGNTNQTNPIDGLPGFDFNGLTFVTGQNANSQLGASVAAIGDVNGDGRTDFVIGAPVANDVLGTPNGAGRAYVIYGSPAMATQTNKIIDLDNLNSVSGINVVTFVSDLPGGHLGRGVGTAGNFLGSGGSDVVIGAPDAQINNLGGSGVTYVISDANGGVLRPATTQTVLINDVGQPNGRAGVQIAGANASDRAGFSVATAGDTSGSGFNDLLIGAPANNIGGAGAAYLLYGSANYASKAVLDTTTGVTYVSLSRVLTPLTAAPAVPGAVFVGDASLDETGWAVAQAGDFNGDGLSDFLIGSPGENNNAGRATLIYGRSAASGAGPITGLVNLGAIPTSIDSVNMEGAQINALAGYSLSGLGDINGDGLNEILIGSPGFNNFSGAVYLIPGNPSLFGDTFLAAAASAPLQGQIITTSQPIGPNLVGSSVSGARLNGSNRSVDGAAKTDFIIGAAGFSLNTSRNLAGAGFLIETSRITLPVPTSNAITTTIGVDTAFPPFNINAATPATMQIFVFSNATVSPTFDPVRDIDPTTVIVNGIAFPNATITKDPVDENNDGIEDAIITIQPRSALGLNTSTTTLTIRGKTLASSPNANRIWTGTANITVTGGGGGGGGGAVPGAINNGFAGFNTEAFPPYFGERLVPTLPVVGINQFYKPIPQFVAYQTFRPDAAFSARTRQFFFPKNHKLGTRQPGGHNTSTLGHQVFTRSKFPQGVFNGKIHHKGKVI